VTDAAGHRGRSSQPYTLRRRIGLSFAGLGGLLVGLTAVVVLSVIKFVHAGNQVVYRWDPAVTATQRLLTDLVDQETGLRGYALSGNPAFLTPYRASRAAERDESARLRDLVGDDQRLSERVAELTSAAQRWQTTIADAAIDKIGRQDEAGVRLVESGAAKRLFDDIRQRAAALSAAVDDRAADARHDRRTYSIVLVTAIGLTGVMLLLIAVAIWRALHRWVLAPVDQLAGQTRQVARGDTYKQIEPAGPPELTGLGRDVEAMRLQIAGQLARAEEIQEELRQRSLELSRSNDDLQQFAYVASHDLSEPLRKVANFCQLLERQYRDQLDDRAKQYIDFAVDGAKRMQALISDLLALSRVGRTTEEFVPVPLDKALDSALDNLATRIEESGARVERLTPLPTVQGDRALLTSLLENLVSNAVKYRREDVSPEISIAAEQNPDDRLWTVTVRDNGIGVDPQYAERIFAIFQRLHLRDSYGGTGIGLALCRKIVEFHGGDIWLDPVQSGDGATFRFSLPEGGNLAKSRG
jgi:signal transduction histidine kinase